MSLGVHLKSMYCTECTLCSDGAATQKEGLKWQMEIDSQNGISMRQ